MRFITGAAFIVATLAVSIQARAQWVRTDGDCAQALSGGLWAAAEQYGANPDGTREELVCSMGIGCNGRAWNTCNLLGKGPAVADPVRPYHDAAFGDSLRTMLGDRKNHISAFTVTAGEVITITDRPAYYRVYNLSTGSLIYEDMTPVSPHERKSITVKIIPAGSYMVLAYDPANNISIGYKAFRK